MLGVVVFACPPLTEFPLLPQAPRLRHSAAAESSAIHFFIVLYLFLYKEKRLKTLEAQAFFPIMVGVSGFEPEASWTRTKRDTKLRHTPLTLVL